MKCHILFFITTVVAINVNAQKLPNKQDVTLRAPVNVKIDGKVTEWGALKAYNSAIEVNYTIANDNENLYLIVHALDPVVIRKIIAGGITFSVNVNKDNSVNEVIAVTYPIVDRKAPPKINLRNKQYIMQSAATADSFMLAANKEINAKAKQIKMRTANAVNDTLLSVYNEEGVTTAARFDNKAEYTYELALPLKYVAMGGSKTLNYNIKLNGSAYAEEAFFEMIEGGMRVSSPTLRGKDLPAIKDMQLIAVPTDMSGTYTLAY